MRGQRHEVFCNRHNSKIGRLANGDFLSMADTNTKSIVRKLVRWFKMQIPQNVPESIAFCEFECSKPTCRMGEWLTCEKRLNDLKYFASGKQR